MIPLKLKLRNFMCYRDNVPVLDFNGIRTACISGDNGNGKSTLIDAMTWALWGKSRARKTDDDLISLGTDETEVTFDFAVENQVYRIVRKHARPKKAAASGQSSLDLLIQNGDSFRLNSGNSMGETQQRIVNTVHMDYQTFINSALILQGRADEFTLKAPARRAEVLSEILGFSYYDALAQDANDMARAAGSERGQLESAITEMTLELAGRATAELDRERVTGALAAAVSTSEVQGQRLDELKRRQESLEAKEGECRLIETRLAENRRVLAHLQAEGARQAARIKEFEALRHRRFEIEGSFAELTAKRRADSDMNQRLRDAAGLNDRRHKLELRIRDRQQILMSQHDLSLHKIADLEKILEKLPELRRAQAKSQEALLNLDRQERELGERRQELDELRAALGGLKQAAAQRELKAREIEEKLMLLRAGGDHCPLCGSAIGENELKTIETSYTAERAGCLEDLKSGRGAVQARQKELEMREKEAHTVEAGLNRERPGIQARAGVIEKEITEAEGARTKLTAEKEILAEIEGSLNRRDFAAAEERLLAETLGELSRLKYDETAHRTLQTRVAELEPYAELQRRLEEADRLTGAEQEAYTRTMETIRATQAAGDLEGRRKAALDAELILLPQIKRDTANAEKERQRCVAAQREIETTLYAINAKIERFVVLEKLRGEKRLRLARVAEEENIFKDLGQAFGKKGVQQMFIEAAIPEIEAEANKLLSRMTDNRMHLKFDTLRQSRRGDALETLDINIADELGTRDYEMYSGGEAFRINFAIRIALSRLLARRAGAPLRTLIIDEGFGTQDATGIEKIKEAIGAIQEDFERILVVTHIEELRDAFPNRINVVKGPAGSTIEIM